MGGMGCMRSVGIIVLGLVLMLSAVVGCSRTVFRAEQATRAYPHHLHNTRTMDIQVFRDDTTIRIVNTSPISFSEFDLWLNQRYVQRIASLPAGATLELSLWDFYDDRGEVYNAGGFFAAFDPTPLRLTQIQVDDDTPLIGLITIRSETADG